ncbi:Stk1 family PASTA domain-containing Ser/Thr kinase [Microbacterium sp. YY-01]|uniref:Stk1 family PASTA domain-containing Ser/Thr kinase n=1 Tax=Microbacterium sp. YY-01 TaxID=3421634 RepID=UPI003D1805BA
MASGKRVLSGRYRVDEMIGQGGMARVYRGYDMRLDREVAVKILDPKLAHDRAFRTRFRLEAQAASRMSHPSIVRVFDAGEDSSTEGEDPVPFIVMELVHGKQLKDVIAEGPIPVADALRYVDGILEALEYSHRAGIVHRDIKPGNVMVTESDTIKVMDFGIARAVSDSSSTVAETTQIIGTASYFSPEQAKGEQVDARTDLYSAGIVLYELLTGRTPFRGETPVAVAYQHVSEAPVPPTEENTEVPGALDPVVLTALAKDPFQRYQDAASFRRALDEAATGKAPSKRKLGALSNELYGADPRQAAETARTLRQLSSDTTVTRTQTGPPVAWIWTGIAILAILLVSVLFWVLSIRSVPQIPTTARTVPVLEGSTWERAEADLLAVDLVAVRIDQTNGEVAKGNVIGSEPGAGTHLEPGQSVTVYVSSGAEMVTVPSLEGLDEATAREQIEKAGLVVGVVLQRNDPELAKGTVIRAVIDGVDAVPDSEVVPGSVIDLTVASGVVSVDDVKGWELSAAVAALEKLGLTATTVAIDDCAATDPYTVASMSVAPGDVTIRSTVELNYCAGE